MVPWLVPIPPSHGRDVEPGCLGLAAEGTTRLDREKGEAMKKLMLAFLLIGIVLITSTIRADDSTRESFYRECVQKKIESCERKAAHVDSEGPNLRRCGEDSVAQATFYRQNQEELVKDMMGKNIGERRAAVNHFLIKAYKKNADQVVTAAGK